MKSAQAVVMKRIEEDSGKEDDPFYFERSLRVKYEDAIIHLFYNNVYFAKTTHNSYSLNSCPFRLGDGITGSTTPS